MSEYAEFLEAKRHQGADTGRDPEWIPTALFPFQRHLLEWGCRKGRAAIFADCGLGKTALQLAWAENVVRWTDGRVLILTPLAVGHQTVREGAKFGIGCEQVRDGAFGGARIVVSNYEQLHRFRADDFAGVACDESSILKHFSGATQKAVSRFMSHVRYRSLWTATAAPNDFYELGTSSEALGYLGHSDMLTRFFRQTDKIAHRLTDVRAHHASMGGNHFAKLAFRVSQTIGQWRLKGHAERDFWRWVASWARACRKPSDLGFEDDGFVLPPLTEREHIVKPTASRPGVLPGFDVPAIGLAEEREERRRTLKERVQAVADLVDHDRPVVVWCHLNEEGDRLERAIPGAVQVAGRDSDEVKEERILAFLRGDVRVLITKPKIAGLGLNMQHCAHVVTFATHSWESYYQSVRRCWRFGQTQPVVVDVVSTEAEQRVRESLMRKSQAADTMFAQIVAHMRDALSIARDYENGASETLPAWLGGGTCA